MSPIRFRPKKDEEDEALEEINKENEETSEENNERKETKEEKKFQIKEMETVETTTSMNDKDDEQKEKGEKTKTSTYDDVGKNIDKELNKKDFKKKTIELELVGKDDNSNILADLFGGKNLIVVTLPDKTNFITTEENFENIKKQFGFSENQFRITHNLQDESVEIPSFLLKQADIQSGDPLFFKYNESDKSIEIKKKH